MDIVDAQVHVFHVMDAEQCLFAMDCLGIQGVIIDESWHPGEGPNPSQKLPNGIVRPLALGGKIASMKYPDRFRHLRRVDYRDPDLETIVRQSAEDPHCVALRAEAWQEHTSDLENGAYLPLFRAAAKEGIPVFVLTLSNSPALESSIAAVPECKFIIDHIGLVKTPAAFDDLLSMAKYPNLSLKWSHSHRAFPKSDFPFPPIQAGLRRAVDAFGVERIFWASDATMIQPDTNWAEALFHVRECKLLTREEREWVLGRSARKALGWEAPTA